MELMKMNKQLKIIFFIYSAFFLIFSNFRADAYPLLNTTRASGLSAFTGIADDAGAVLYNPAGLSTIDNHEIVLNSNDIYGLGIKHNQLFYTFPLQYKINFGFAVSNISFNDNELDAAENNYCLALSGKLFTNFFAGAAFHFSDIKGKFSGINMADGSANSCDAGFLFYREHLKLGVNFINFGNAKIKYDDGMSSKYSDKIIRTGISYKFDKLLAGVDFDNNDILYTGMEYELVKKIFRISAGVRKQFSPSDSLRFSTGFRFTFEDIYLDYSNEFNNSLGPSHKFGIGYKFGFKDYIRPLNITKTQNIFLHQKNLYSSAIQKEPVVCLLKNTLEKKIKVTITAENSEFLSNKTKSEIEIPAKSEYQFIVPMSINSEFLYRSEISDKNLNMSIIYNINNREYTDNFNIPLKIYPINSMIWNDPYKIGNFINPKSQAVEKFCSKLFSQYSGQEIFEKIPSNIAKCFILFNALKSLNFKYEKDTKFPFKGASSTLRELEFINHPFQTLEKKKGDCDDLTILFASMLLNLGIDVKIILTVDHIFLMFNPGLTNKEEKFFNSNYLVEYRGKYFMPLEPVMIDNSFFNSCIFAKSNFENLKNKEIVSMADIWNNYEPLNITENYNPDIPLKSAVDPLLKQDYIDFSYRLAESSYNLADTADLTQTAQILINEKKYNEALSIYLKQLQQLPHDTSILNNLGNLYYLTGNYQRAIDYFLLASEIEKNNPYYFMQISLLYLNLDDKIKSKYFYNKVLEINQEYPQKYILEIEK